MITEFQELLDAYWAIGNLIEESENYVVDDDEEDLARKEFKQSNVEKINKTSVTIKIKTALVNAWDAVFTEKYGTFGGIGQIMSTIVFFLLQLCFANTFDTGRYQPYQIRSAIDSPGMLIQSIKK